MEKTAEIKSQDIPLPVQATRASPRYYRARVALAGLAALTVTQLVPTWPREHKLVNEQFDLNSLNFAKGRMCPKRVEKIFL